MSYSTWPTTLPQAFQQDGFSDQFPDCLIETTMETGYSKVRRRYTAAVEPISGTMNMTKAQYTIFRTFFESDLAYGSLPFYFPVPPSGTSTLVRLKVKSLPSTGAIQHEATVKLTLEVLP